MAVQSQDTQPLKKGRLLFIDNLRILLTALVILHHLAIQYGGSGITYYKEKQPEIQNIIDEKGVAAFAVGKNVIVRTQNEGINIGTVVSADSTGVILKNARRIWYHKPADKTLSWYEGVAISGLSDDSKVSPTVDIKIIVEDYSMTVVSEDAYKSIMEKVCVNS